MRNGGHEWNVRSGQDGDEVWRQRPGLLTRERDLPHTCHRPYTLVNLCSALPSSQTGCMDESTDPVPESTRELFLEVAELLEAIVIALQTDPEKPDSTFVMREAVRRVVRLREHLNQEFDAGD